MQSGLFQASRSNEQATPGEERAWAMHEVGYSSAAQMEDDTYLLPASRKPRHHIVKSFVDFARRLARH